MEALEFVTNNGLNLVGAIIFDGGHPVILYCQNRLVLLYRTVDPDGNETLDYGEILCPYCVIPELDEKLKRVGA